MSLIIPTAEPFFFPGKGRHARIGCLVLHGFTGTPKEVRGLGEHLNGRGCAVCGIRLTGHASRPDDMVRSRCRDWLLSVEDGYHLLRSCTDQVFLLGLSMGGILALASAARLPVRGVVAMSVPYEMPVRMPLPLWSLRLLSRLVPYRPKSRAPGWGWFDQDARKQHIAYPQNPVRSGVELKLLLDEMRRALPRITVPVLLIHSRNDTYVLPEHMPRLHAALGTADKQMVWVEGGGHVITEEPTCRTVFAAASEFIERVAAA
jgi:carboxylesterase